MLPRSRIPRWVAVLATVAVITGACQQAASPSASGTASAPAASAATPEPSPSIPIGGTITYVTFAEPLTLNPRMVPEGIAFQVSELINRGLTDFDNQGNVITELAEKVPDPADGDVTDDLLTVTWKLKEGLKWSDGSPVTSDDVRYTWEVCGDPTTGCAKSAGLTDVESVETPDDLTIILHYKVPFFDYKIQFKDGLLPRACADCGAPGDIAKWKYFETVNPNLGPFSIKEWVHGEQITLERNPNFYQEGKPYLDGVNVIFRDDIEVFRQAILNGEADVSPWLTKPAEAQVRELLDRGIKIGSGSTPYLNRLQLNLLDPKERSKPHPILGDVKVREAVLRGTDVSKVTADWGIPGIYEASRLTSRSDLYGPDWTCNAEPIAYDLDGAKALLDGAGWAAGSDGIRSKGGVRMSLRVSTYTGFYQEDNVVAWIEELKNLGVDARADNYTATELYSSFADGSPMFRGNFDLLYYDFAKDFGADPHLDYDLFYRSTNVPSEENSSGRNMNGVDSPEIDQLLDEASTTLDPTMRKESYCRITEIVTNELFADNYTGLIPNFQMVNPKIQGWTDGEQFVWFGSDSENWYLQP